MYTFINAVSDLEHDAYVLESGHNNLLQSSKWAEVKSNWSKSIVGVKENDKLIASSLILSYSVAPFLKVSYIPRGPVLDFDNKELVKFYIDNIKKWAKEQGSFCVILDPAIEISTYKINEDKEYKETALNNIDYLKSLGIIHKGFTEKISETIQPRYHMRVDLNKYDFDKLSKRTKQSFNTSNRRGVKISNDTLAALDDFAKVIEYTEKRKDVSLRNKDYFENMLKIYGEDAQIFLARLDIKDRIFELNEIIKENKKLLEQTELSRKEENRYKQELNNASKEKESLEKLSKKYSDSEYIAGGIMVGFGNTAEKLYAGMNSDFNSYRPQYNTYVNQFEYAKKLGYRYVNMGGVEGSLEDGLSTFKLNFDPEIIEYVGEFEIPINKFLHKLYTLYRKYR